MTRVTPPLPTMDYKADARRRFESHRAASRRHRGRGRGRGARVGVGVDDRDGSDDDGEHATTTSQLFDNTHRSSRDTSTTRARRGANAATGDKDVSSSGVSDDAGYERAMTRGADLELLLRDASLACLPRQNRDSTYFDVNWTIDALRNIERDLGVDSNGGDVAGALAIDCDVLSRHLEAASLAQLLGLPNEYEVECGIDGPPGVALTRSMPVESVASASKKVDIDSDLNMTTATEAVPPRKKVVVDDDDWLDELLEDE